MPTLGLGRWRVAGVGGGGYAGIWRPLYGGRLGYRLINAPFDLLGVELAGEVVGGVPGRFLGAGALTLDLGSVAVLHARGVPNLGSKTGFFEIGAGLHLASIFGHLGTSGTSRASAPAALPADNPGFLDFVEQHTFVELSDMLYAVVDGSPHLRCDVARQLDRLLATTASTPPATVSALADAARRLGLGQLADALGASDGIVARARTQAQGAGTDQPPAKVVSAVLSGVSHVVREARRSKLPST